MKKEIYTGIDIGGTHVAAAAVKVDGGVVERSLFKRAINAAGSIDETVGAWRQLMYETLEYEPNTVGVGFSMPGPFDYERGISMIEGVAKFNSLFGLNIKEYMRSALNGSAGSIAFINDAAAFALGEYYCGAAKGSQKSLVITLGTGFGSAFLVGDVPQTTASQEVPANGYLYNTPFKDSIADDYFSTRWFVRTWEERTGQKVGGVKDIAQSAVGGDAVAKAMFAEFAAGLAEVLAPKLAAFKPDTLVIGGNIARASDMFLDDLVNNLKIKHITDTKVRICEKWDEAPLIGAALYAGSKSRNLEAETLNSTTPLRKTTQFLAPTKSMPTAAGQYDIYPAFPVGNGKIHSDLKTLAEMIAAHKTIVIDGFEGVFWDSFTASLNIELLKHKKNICIYSSDAAMKSEEELKAMIIKYLGDDDSIFGKITDLTLADWFDAVKLTNIKPNPDADINILIGCGAALAGWDAPIFYVDLPKNELQFRMRAGTASNLGFKKHTEKQTDFKDMYKQAFFVDWIVLNRHKASLLPQIEVVIDAQRPDNHLFMKGDDLRSGLSAMSHNFFRVRPWFESGAWGGQWMKNHFEGLNKEAENLAWSFELMVAENGLMFESDGYRLEVSFDFLMFNNFRDVLGDCADRFGYDFPIRFDFLDTIDGGNLSVQCHPRPEYIKSEFGMPFTQDETYYILDCKNNPKVYLGFREGVEKDEFHKALIDSQKNGKEIDIDRYVRSFRAKKHDLFLIPNGTVHASGKDNLVLEISSAPYIFTFKMYDWMRLDLDGLPRPINIEHGIKNLYFERQGNSVEDELICKPYIISDMDGVKIEHLPTHKEQFYDVMRYSFDNKIDIETGGKFHVWMLVEGVSVTIETAAGMRQRFNFAETFVIPASSGSYSIYNEANTRAMMVKAFIK
ncbi:MAG: ROK family protein [Tannerella sp.]|jgi:predicted NBD/HSP70 family sugar kinase/mannose-6-phosphate isomerase class I|nr:ROK family protein [Tannerella sp.]